MHWEARGACGRGGSASEEVVTQCSQEGTRVGVPNALWCMYGEGGARVGDHTSSVLGRVADSQWHWLMIVGVIGEIRGEINVRPAVIRQIHRQLSETGK